MSQGLYRYPTFLCIMTWKLKSPHFHALISWDGAWHCHMLIYNFHKHTTFVPTLCTTLSTLNHVFTIDSRVRWREARFTSVSHKHNCIGLCILCIFGLRENGTWERRSFSVQTSNELSCFNLLFHTTSTLHWKAASRQHHLHQFQQNR